MRVEIASYFCVSVGSQGQADSSSTRGPLQGRGAPFLLGSSPPLLRSLTVWHLISRLRLSRSTTGKTPQGME